MPFVAGNDIDAHCPTCGRDRDHTVMVVHGGLVHEVRCKECREVHPYKRPTKPTKAEKAPKKAPAKPRSKKPAKKETAAGQRAPREWQDLVFGVDPETVRPYSLKETFAVNDVLSHPKFGLGVVTAIHEDGKLDIVFRDGVKRLVHGRP